MSGSIWLVVIIMSRPIWLVVQYVNFCPVVLDADQNKQAYLIHTSLDWMLTGRQMTLSFVQLQINNIDQQKNYAFNGLAKRLMQPSPECCIMAGNNPHRAHYKHNFRHWSSLCLTLSLLSCFLVWSALNRSMAVSITAALSSTKWDFLWKRNHWHFETNRG